MAGQSATSSLLLEVEYGFTDRLSASVGVPYVFAKYTGALPPPSLLAVDACQCWNSSFQDFSFAARYRFGGPNWAVTPTLRYDRPSHDYAYQGEAVVGRNLNELLVGISAGTRLGGALSRASVQVGYTYAIVEKPLEDVPINRSNTAFEAGYALDEPPLPARHRRLAAHARRPACRLGDGCAVPVSGRAGAHRIGTVAAARSPAAVALLAGRRGPLCTPSAPWTCSPRSPRTSGAATPTTARSTTPA